MDTSLPAETEMSRIEASAPLSVPGANGVGILYSDSRVQPETSHQRHAEVTASQGLSEIEVMHTSVHNFESEDFPEFSLLSNEAMEQKKSCSPILVDTLVCGGKFKPCQLNPLPPTSVTRGEAPEGSGTEFSFGPMSPGLVIQPRPPSEKQKRGPRKRKRFFDQSVALTDELIKKLRDPSRLVRYRKKLPCTNLGVWSFNNQLRRENVLLQPLISGLCTNLQRIYKKGFIPSKAGSISIEDTRAELVGVQSPAPTPVLDIEIEHLQSEEDCLGPRSIPEMFLAELVPSPLIRDELTPTHTSSLGPAPETQSGMFAGTELLPAPDLEGSNRTAGFDPGALVTHLEEHFSLKHTDLSDISELLNSAEVDDLSFLEPYETPTGYQENEVDSTERTRAVAQYLKGHSPSTSNPEGPSGFVKSWAN